jgi:hypothetical protein
MSDDTVYSDEELESLSQDQNVNPQLRQAYKALRDRTKALEKQIADQTEETRKAAVLKEIADRQLDPRIADLVPKDTDPLKWFENYADVLGVKKPPAPPENQKAEGQADQTQGQQNAHEDATANAYQDIANTMSGTSGVTNVQDLMQRLSDPALTKEQLDKLITTSGSIPIE